MRLRTEAQVLKSVLALLLVTPATAAGGDPSPVLGEAYSIEGVQFRPADSSPSDETGYAGVIPSTREGATTSVGEAYASAGVSGMHRTLPLPSYVEVTALASGRTILVRLTDRGPRATDRVVDLSCGAVAQLGLSGSSPVAVRVRRVSPPDQEKGALRSGGQAAERLATPEPLLAVLRKKLPAPPKAGVGPSAACNVTAPTTVAAPPIRSPETAPAPPRQVTTAPTKREAPPPSRAVPPQPMTEDDGFIIEEGRQTRRATQPPRETPAPATGYVVQIAALSSRAAADALARRAGGHVETVGALHRVRTGPYANEAAARAALKRLHAKGFASARLVASAAR